MLAGYDRDFASVQDHPQLRVQAVRVPGWRVVELDRERQTVGVPRGVVAVSFGGYYLADVPFANMGWHVWLAVAYIILVPTVGAYYLSAWALERAAPSTVAVYVYLQPLVAYTAAPFFLGAEESLNARTFVAAAFIFAGVAVVTLRRRGGVMADVSEHPDALGH